MPVRQPMFCLNGASHSIPHCLESSDGRRLPRGRRATPGSRTRCSVLASRERGIKVFPTSPARSSRRSPATRGPRAVAVFLGVARVVALLGPWACNRCSRSCSRRRRRADRCAAFLMLRPISHGQLAGERHQLEVADAQRRTLRRRAWAAAAAVGSRVVLLEQGEVGVQPRELLHGLNVLQVRLDARRGCRRRACARSSRPSACRADSSARRCDGNSADSRCWISSGRNVLKLMFVGFSEASEPLLLRLDRRDAPLEIGGPRQRDDLVAAPSACRRRFGLIFRTARSTLRPSMLPSGSASGGPIDLLVAHGVDVAAAALHEERHGAVAERFLDHLRGEAGEVRRVALARRIHDRMAGEVVEHRQRRAVLAIEPQQADLRIDRADRGDVFIARRSNRRAACPPRCRPSSSPAGSR